MQKFIDACKAGPDEPKAPPSSTVKGSIPSNHKIQVDGECIMQNKQLQSDWQQESASENLVGFVKYWPLGCQTGKWEIEKKKQQNKMRINLPQPSKTIITEKSTRAIFYIFQKQDNYTKNWRVNFFNGKDSFFFQTEP